MDAHRKKCRDVALDRNYINKTTLRSSRIQKLRELTADGALDVPLIPDGLAEDVVTAATPALTDASPSPVSGADGAPLSAPAPPATVGATSALDADVSMGADPAGGPLLSGTRSCYTCKRRYRQLHKFYDQLCPTCAELNYQKRYQTADLRGYVAVVTGGRVKIGALCTCPCCVVWRLLTALPPLLPHTGYRCVLKLLRCGAEVVATTRFPHESTSRFTAEKDFREWSHRLHVVGLDLRNSHSIEEFCEFVLGKFKRVDVLVNNACQVLHCPAAEHCCCPVSRL